MWIVKQLNEHQDIFRYPHWNTLKSNFQKPKTRRESWKHLITYKWFSVTLPAKFSREMWRSQGSGLVYLSTKKKISAKNLLSTKTVLQKWKETLRHHQINKSWGKFMTTRSVLKSMIKGVLQSEMKGHLTITWENNLSKGQYTDNFKLVLL